MNGEWEKAPIFRLKQKETDVYVVKCDVHGRADYAVYTGLTLS